MASFKTVLVIDDDPSVLTTIDDILNTVGFDVDLASNAQEAAKRLAEHLPDLILLDVAMPDATSPELRALIREQNPASTLPVIVITPFEHATRYLKEMDARDFITKPLNLKDVLAKVEAVFG